MMANNKEQALLKVWWVRLLIALAFLGLSYGFISLAIDSAHWLEYAIGLLFLIWGVKHIIRAARLVFKH